MNTRKFFFILSVVLVSFQLKGQAFINPDIQSSLDAFIQHSNNKEWDKAFDLLYPKLFTRVAKQDLVDLMLGMEADGMSLRMSNTRITSTSVPVVEGNETFVRVEYVADLTVQIEKDGIYDSPKAIQAIDEQFRNTYGQQRVKWNEGKHDFQIIAQKAMMAIQTEDKSWKLVEINMDQPELMEYIFSPSIMQSLVRIE
jgi:hypothetical protein